MKDLESISHYQMQRNGNRVQGFCCQVLPNSHYEIQDTELDGHLVWYSRDFLFLGKYVFSVV